MVQATTIASHSRLRKHCMLAGERHRVVPANSLNAFQREPNKMGYALPAE